MRFEFHRGVFGRRELWLLTKRSIWAISLSQGIHRFSFKRFEAAFEHYITGACADAIKRLGGEAYLAKVKEAEERRAKAAWKQGMTDIDRYTVMLRQYKQFGACQNLKPNFDVKEATAWRPEDDHRLPEEKA